MFTTTRPPYRIACASKTPGVQTQAVRVYQRNPAAFTPVIDGYDETTATVTDHINFQRAM